MSASLTASILTLCLLSVLAAAAWQDWKTRLIPNVLPLIIVGIAIIAIVILPSHRASWVDRSLALAIMLVIGTLLGMARIMGGGDIKLLAALAPWHGLVDLPVVLLLIGIAGGCVALAFVSSAALAGKGWRSGLRAKVPYALAIFLGESAFAALSMAPN